MDLKVLRYFVATVESGSITAASIACHVAQPSITLAVAKLEDEFACKLFDRHRKGMRPTPDGLKMYTMAKDLLSHANSIKNEFTHVKENVSLSLRVDQNIRIAVLEHFIRELHENTENINLTLLYSNDGNDSACDMQLIPQSKLNAMDWFFPLMTECYALLIPRSNHLAFKPALTIDDLQSQALITRTHCENKLLFDSTCKEFELEFNSVAEVETEEWAQALVRSGLGICFAPVPSTFKDDAIEVRYIETIFSMNLPERVVGLSVKPTKHERIKKLLPYLFK